MESVIKKRPVLLTIVCVLGYTWIVFSLPAVFSPAVKKLGDWYPALFGLLVATNFISFVGVWHMKRWGVNLFIITFFIKETIYIIINDTGYSFYTGIAFSVFFISSMIVFYKRMDVNL